MKRQAGLTLIELMVTLAVAVTLLGTGVPGFRSLMENNRLTAQANGLFADLVYARTEAVRRGSTIRVVARDGDWNQGWNVVDASLAETDPDWLIKAGDLPEGGVTLTASDSVLEIDYRNSGALVGQRAVQLSLCTSNGQGRQVTVQAIGRVGVERVDCQAL